MAFIKKLTSGYSQLWKAIIRPPRDEYDIADLGSKVLRLDDMRITREDIELCNDRGHRLQCSWFEPQERVAQQLPCVIYLHGNCSSRLEALPLVPALLSMNVCLFCLDLSGSGKSDGEYISLGWYEREDLQVVVEYLRGTGKVSTIGLWGRSMGAVTALLYADRDPSIAGMVLDSPFADLKVLAKEIASGYARVPNFILSTAIKIIQKAVKKKAGFDISNLTPIRHVGSSFIPALFAYGMADTFIQPHHCTDLYQAYAGDKQIQDFEGDHNSDRPEIFLDQVQSFFYTTLQCDLLPYVQKKSISDMQFNIGKVRHQIPDQISQLSDLTNMNEAEAYEDEEDEEIRRAIQLSLQEMPMQPVPAPAHANSIMDLLDQRVLEADRQDLYEATLKFMSDIGY